MVVVRRRHSRHRPPRPSPRTPPPRAPLVPLGGCYVDGREHRRHSSQRPRVRPVAPGLARRQPARRARCRLCDGGRHPRRPDCGGRSCARPGRAAAGRLGTRWVLVVARLAAAVEPEGWGRWPAAIQLVVVAVLVVVRRRWGGPGQTAGVEHDSGQTFARLSWRSLPSSGTRCSERSAESWAQPRRPVRSPGSLLVSGPIAACTDAGRASTEAR